MAASKNPASEHDPTPPRATSPAPGRDASNMVLVHDHVLADVRHEIGNFFHKLYYWAETLGEKEAERAGDGSAPQMLERTIRNLEDFLKVALEYFHPTHLSLTRMPIADVVGGLASVVRGQLNGTPLTVAEEGTWAGAGVMVDPSHLSRVLGVVSATLVQLAGADSRLEVVVGRTAREGAPCLDVTLALRSPKNATIFRTSRAGIEWAVAQKVIQLHGGELGERVGADGSIVVALVLPLGT